ncbi:MAG: protein BatD, partial [Hymenobacter sp.]
MCHLPSILSFLAGALPIRSASAAALLIACMRWSHVSDYRGMQQVFIYLASLQLLWSSPRTSAPACLTGLLFGAAYWVAPLGLQQIKVNYKIYTRVDILGGQPDKAPELNGFWNQDVISKTNAPWKSEVYKGLRYNVTTIKQSILFPQHAGNLSIDPLSVSFGVRLPLPAVNILGSVYNNYRDVAYKAKSQPVIIHAMALPDAGKPVDFSGAVGSFSFYTDADKKVLKANETLDYTAEISGTGNLSLINPPKLTLPVDIEKYDPKTTDRITTDSNGVSGSRKFSYLLIPRHQGDFTLNPATFTYFNPATRKYVTLQGKPFSIKVNKGDALANAPAFNSSEQQDIKLLGNDIR